MAKSLTQSQSSYRAYGAALCLIVGFIAHSIIKSRRDEDDQHHPKHADLTSKLFSKVQTRFALDRVSESDKPQLTTTSVPPQQVEVSSNMQPSASLNNTSLDAESSPSLALDEVEPIVGKASLVSNITSALEMDHASVQERTPNDISYSHYRSASLCVCVLLVVGGLVYAWYLRSSGSTKDLLHSYIELGACFLGLVISLVVYGIMQEYIMTLEYKGGRFPSSSFLVFCNRILGLLVCSIILIIRGESCLPEGSHWCSLPAVTLTISTLSQYCSLRYVSFSTQNTFKSGKIVPTMAIGTCVTGTSYNLKEYGKAFAITTCVVGFSWSMEHPNDKNEGKVFIGLGLLCLFLFSDALTSNLQKRVFSTYEAMSHWQMNFTMTAFAVFYTAVPIAFQNPLGLFAFLANNPDAWGHILCLSVFAVTGSLFNLYIVKRYGPAVLAVMMTLRQFFSMVFSAILFGHYMSVVAWCFACCTFLIVLGDAAHQLWNTRQSDCRPLVNHNKHGKLTSLFVAEGIRK